MDYTYDDYGRRSSLSIDDGYSVTYTYDEYGRMKTINTDTDTDTFTYNYLQNSNLIASIDYPHNIKVTTAYEPNRDLILSVENKYNSTVISKYSYINDALGRRVSMEKSGAAFPATDTITYGYNTRNEVISAVSANNNLYNYGYNFDTIGNRITASLAGNSLSYTTNNLNQYTQITSGQTTIQPTYNDDGCMASVTLDSKNWTFSWNGENRLITAETHSTEGPQSELKLNFTYDYMGRRIEKKVYFNDNLIRHVRFVYDGYLQIEELDAPSGNTVTKRRVWGGGKIIADYHNQNGAFTAYYALGDANKNITEYIDSSGNISAHYEYSPFGRITVSTGTIPSDFDFHFSSEYYDPETKLVYYNYRYYSPELGRWLSRDPVNENITYNLYSFIVNSPCMFIDILGLCTVGNIRNIVPEGKITPSTSNPSMETGKDELLEAIGDFNQYVSFLESLKAATSDFKKPIEERLLKEAAEKMLSDSVSLDSSKIAEIARKVIRDAAENWDGLYIWVRIRYEQCEKCFLICTCWHTKYSQWKRVKNGGLNGLYQNKLRAIYVKAIEMQKLLEEFQNTHLQNIVF